MNLGGAVVAASGALAAAAALPLLGFAIGLATIVFAATAALSTLVGTRLLRRRLLPWAPQAVLWTIALASTGLLVTVLSMLISAASGAGGEPEILWIYWPLAVPIFVIYLFLSAFVGRERTSARVMSER